METAEWIDRCAARLRRQWPNVDRIDLEHAAQALRAEERWVSMEPDQAAEQWLRLGMPEEALQGVDDGGREGRDRTVGQKR